MGRDLTSILKKRNLEKNHNAIAPKRRAVTFGQIMGCLGSGACGAAVAAACVTEGTVTLEAGCLAAGGILANLGCTDAVKSCVGKRRRQLTKAKSRGKHPGPKPKKKKHEPKPAKS